MVCFCPHFEAVLIRTHYEQHFITQTYFKLENLLLPVPQVMHYSLQTRCVIFCGFVQYPETNAGIMT
jgi:hypothetical protein